MAWLDFACAYPPWHGISEAASLPGRECMISLKLDLGYVMYECEAKPGGCPSFCHCWFGPICSVASVGPIVVSPAPGSQSVPRRWERIALCQRSHSVGSAEGESLNKARDGWYAVLCFFRKAEACECR